MATTNRKETTMETTAIPAELTAEYCAELTGQYGDNPRYRVHGLPTESWVHMGSFMVKYPRIEVLHYNFDGTVVVITVDEDRFMTMEDYDVKVIR